MDARVFISHSPKDADPAMTVCSELERRNVRCWIAPRDIAPGDKDREAIAKAIRHARVMVLIHTKNANGADIAHELALASQYELAIIPLCVDDVALSGAPADAAATYRWSTLFRSSQLDVDRLASRIAAIAVAGDDGGVAADASDRSSPTPRSGGDFITLFMGHLTFFGLIGLLLQSWLPVGFGLLLLFPTDEFVEWAAQKIGIRFVPDALGPKFIKALVFMTGWGVLSVYSKQSAPGWLSPWLPSDASWSTIAGMALAAAVLTTVSATLVRRLLPHAGIAIAPGSLSWTTIEFLVALLMLGLVIGAVTAGDWLTGH